MLCMCCSVRWAMLTNLNISEWWKGDVRNSLHHLRLSFSSQYCDEITTVNIRAALNQVTHGHKDRWLGTWHHLVFDTWSIVLKLKVRTVRCEAGHQHLPQHMYKLAASISNDKTASLYNFFFKCISFNLHEILWWSVVCPAQMKAVKPTPKCHARGVVFEEVLTIDLEDDELASDTKTKTPLNRKPK